MHYLYVDALQFSQESESEEDMFDEGDDDVEEEHDHEPEDSVKPEPEVKKHAEVSAPPPLPPKETERQLSKKERKKKELAELEALLADFGVAPKESTDGQDETQGNMQNFMPHIFQDYSLLCVLCV